MAEHAGAELACLCLETLPGMSAYQDLEKPYYRKTTMFLFDVTQHLAKHPSQR